MRYRCWFILHAALGPNAGSLAKKGQGEQQRCRSRHGVVRQVK